MDQDILERDNQAVAPKWCDEPRKSRSWQETGAARALNRHAERSHVFERTLKKTIVFFIAGLDCGNSSQPISYGLRVV